MVRSQSVGEPEMDISFPQRQRMERVRVGYFLSLGWLNPSYLDSGEIVFMESRPCERAQRVLIIF